MCTNQDVTVITVEANPGEYRRYTKQTTTCKINSYYSHILGPKNHRMLSNHRGVVSVLQGTKKLYSVCGIYNKESILTP